MGEMTADQQQAWMEAASPSEGHEKLKPFVGTFKAVVKMWMEPGAEPMVSEGVMTTDWILGGRFLQQTYKGEAFGGVFEGRGLMGDNNTTDEYEGLWIDTASTAMQTESGTYDDATKTFTMRGSMVCPSTKQPFTKRDVIKVIDDDNHTMEMFFTGPDGQEMKNMEITYTRA